MSGCCRSRTRGAGTVQTLKPICINGTMAMEKIIVETMVKKTKEGKGKYGFSAG